jgi:hypothetical protein
MKLIKAFFLLLIFGGYMLYLHYGSIQPPRIYDCFLFFNEFDLLEVRLNEMYDAVDHFVIVEAEETFRGNPKGLNFKKQEERFKKFADKIIYVPIKGHYVAKTPWKRERYQRNQMIRGLTGCRKQDIILISDVDEIVRHEKVSEIAKPLILGETEAVICNQKMYFGHLNRFHSLWNGTVAMRYSDLKRLSPKNVRKLRRMKAKKGGKFQVTNFVQVEDAGWHFSSVGGVNQYLAKIQAFSHAKLDNEEYTRVENLIEVLRSCPAVPLDATFPTYILQNQSHFRQIGFLD